MRNIAAFISSVGCPLLLATVLPCCSFEAPLSPFREVLLAGPGPFWIVLAYLLFLALAVYLFTIGRRTISIAKGSPRPPSRFGWGRMLLGALLIFGGANNQFHLLSTRSFSKQLEYENATQAAAGNATTIAICIGCVFLILWGIWKGFHEQTIKPGAGL